MQDYVKESPDYVRGILEDTILDSQCRYCSNELDVQSSCVSRCPNCGNEMHSCGD